MQKYRSWSASVAEALLVFSFVTRCVSAVAIAGTREAVSSDIALRFSTATVYGNSGSKSSSISTEILLSTGGTIRSSIATATVFRSGKIETVPVISGGSSSSSINLPPITTTSASSQATSSVSLVSSELAGLIPIINSWKANPTLLKSDTLNEIKPVKSDAEDLIPHLGGGSSCSGCGSKRKRGLLGAIGDMLNRLSCIDEVLHSITDDINADDIAATLGGKTQTACALGGCGDCPTKRGPLSGASMGIVASTEDCASILTRTTSALPTASYGAAGSTAITSPAAGPIAADPSKRSFLSDPVGYDRILDDCPMLDVKPPDPNYVRSLNPTWVSQAGNASGQFFDYPVFAHSAAGVNGLHGCTSVIISSQKGVYISHIWEYPVFINQDFFPTDDYTFKTKALDALSNGTATTQSISALNGTVEAPGPLNAIYSPRVFVLTPYTTKLDRQLYGITTELRYATRAQQLADQIAQIIPGSGRTAFIQGYTRTSAQLSTQHPGTAGRAILEVHPFQFWLTTPNSPADSPGLQVGRWRLWVEDQLLNCQDFWHPLITPPDSIQGRDVGYANPCANSNNDSIASSSSPAAISPGAFKTSSELVSTSTASPSSDSNPSSCKYTVTTEIGITTDAYNIQPTVATMCLCDSSVQVGINTITGTSSTSYLVCAGHSKITVSILQPSTTASPPTPITTGSGGGADPTPPPGH